MRKSQGRPILMCLAALAAVPLLTGCAGVLYRAPVVPPQGVLFTQAVYERAFPRIYRPAGLQRLFDAARKLGGLDEDAIADAMVELLEDEELRGSLRLRGLERASHFSWDRTARETLAVYREACGEA